MDKEPLKILFQKFNFLEVILLFCVLASGIAVSYVGHENRRLHNTFQQELEERNTIQVEWGQLLLEQSTLTVPGRIEKIAKEKLNMEVPDESKIEVMEP